MVGNTLIWHARMPTFNPNILHQYKELNKKNSITRYRRCDKVVVGCVVNYYNRGKQQLTSTYKFPDVTKSGNQRFASRDAKCKLNSDGHSVRAIHAWI